MMLLITNEKYDQEKLTNLSNDLSISGIAVVNDFIQAKLAIDEHSNNINLIVISSVVVDDVKYSLKEMAGFSEFFKGPILAKVDDEKFGVELMREGLINDYYVSSNDKNLEIERLKKAFRVATLRSRVYNTISVIKDSIATLKKVTKGD